MMKKYHYYLTTLFLKNLLTVIVVFIFLSFFLNIFEEIKFFENKEGSIFSNNFDNFKYSINSI